jgi:predicted acetyltransferase
VDWKPRVIDPEELDRTIDISATVFGAGPVAPEDYRKEVCTVAEIDRTFAIDDGPTIVATGGSFTFDVALPGATLPMAGVTEVGVLPTHRRQGILTALMTALFDQAVEREEPLAGLTASEGAIYHRYGYGVAARFQTILVDTTRTAEVVDLAPAGRLRLVDENEAAALLPAAWERHWRETPGEVNRNPKWWEMLAIDPDDDRDGASARFLVVHEDASGAPDGFAAYRLKEGGAPDGYYFELQITDIGAADDQVQAALLR